MMTTTTSISSTMVNHLPPMFHRLSPPRTPEIPQVLDLCVRKTHLSPTPVYSYDYRIPSSNYPAPCVSPDTKSSESENSDVSSTETRDINSNLHCSKISKINRPFKSYPKDPLSIALIGTVSEQILGAESSEAYTEFRDKMLAQVRATHNGTNKNMRRSQAHNHQNSDPTYWEKRRKNNEAAKRSRDARKAKEDEIAIRCAFLEQENLKLRFRIAALESEIQRSQRMFYQ